MLQRVLLHAMRLANVFEALPQLTLKSLNLTELQSSTQQIQLKSQEH